LLDLPFAARMARASELKAWSKGKGNDIKIFRLQVRDSEQHSFYLSKFNSNWKILAVDVKNKSKWTTA